jgi:hypothetical protein
MRAAALVALVVLLALPLAGAHENHTTNGITFRVGWDSEPPTTGVKNLITIEVFDNATGAAKTGLTDVHVTLTAGPVTKAYTDVPESDDAPGTYELALIPTEPGTYTADITATVDGKALTIPGAKLDEVQSSGDLAFPGPAADTSGLQQQVASLKTQVDDLSKEVQDAKASKGVPGFEATAALMGVGALALVLRAARRR